MNHIKHKVIDLINTYGTNDPFTLCDKLGFNIAHLNFNEEYKGSSLRLNNGGLILLNGTMDYNLQRIVLAHEIGHLLFHEVASHYDGSNLEFEFEADLFAAYLLLDESKYDMKFERMNSYILRGELTNSY